MGLTQSKSLILIFTKARLVSRLGTKVTNACQRPTSKERCMTKSKFQLALEPRQTTLASVTLTARPTLTPSSQKKC